MGGYFLGPMDPSEFMGSFMPINSQNLGSPPDGIDFRQVYEQTNERLMYAQFVTIANKVCTNHVVKFTGDRVGPKASPKPDVAFFSKNNATFLRESNDTISPTTSFLHMELFVELKQYASCDPFCDLKNGEMEDRDTVDGDDTHDRCLLYATNQLAYQHRLFAFSLIICGEKTRFLRWDREGIVVSSGIDCSQHHGLVIEFLLRFNQMTAQQRGLDPTAVPATSEEIEMFESAVAKVEINSLRRTVGDQKVYPRFRLEVRGAGDSVSYYIVGKALDYDLGVVGRCTRGYLALDLSTNQCVFLKDMWRRDVPGIEPEHVWYEKLAETGVPHLVRFKHASDVVSTPSLNYYGTVVLNPTKTTSREGAQRGLTSHMTPLFPSHDFPLQGYVHYRFVQAEICRPLSDFMNSKHLVLVVLDSLKACSSAFSDAGLFHRDVSFPNIMIGLDSKGKLNDWDLCRGVNVDKNLEGPRTGTWEFMSTRLLESPGSEHRITDDLESHYFVLMWTALHWVKHNRSDGRSINMEYIFNQQRPLPNGVIKGGGGKTEMYSRREAKLSKVEFACGPFNKLFWDLWRLFAKYLIAQRQRDAEEENSGPEPSVSPQEVIDLFEAALKQPGWINDKVPDQFAASKDASGITLSVVGSWWNPSNPDQGKKRGLSKSLGADIEQLLAKRVKGSSEDPELHVA